jgi:hypothetical protein
MRRISIASAIAVSVVLLSVASAWAQLPPHKTKSPEEVEQAINDYNAKVTNCRSRAREQKLHFLKRRRFIRDCVKNTP